MRYKIVIDSCGELIERWEADPAIERAPLTLTVEGEDIVEYFLLKPLIRHIF